MTWCIVEYLSVQLNSINLHYLESDSVSGIRVVLDVDLKSGDLDVNDPESISVSKVAG